MYCIIPINDIESHNDFSSICKCEPSIIFENEEMIIIHNSFDQRELFEELNLKINDNS